MKLFVDLTEIEKVSKSKGLKNFSNELKFKVFTYSE